MGMTQKTRIEPLPPKRAGPLTRAMYRVAKRRYGQVPEPFAVAAHHPGLVVAGAVHKTMVERASRALPAGVRKLAVFWTARAIGSRGVSTSRPCCNAWTASTSRA